MEKTDVKKRFPQLYRVSSKEVVEVDGEVWLSARGVR